MASTPIPFGYKMAWFAVQTTDARALAGALGPIDIEPIGWQEGIDAAYNASIGQPDVMFLTPPLGNWTLAVGWGDGRYEEQTQELSARFGVAQAFATHRVSEAHMWVLARDGMLIRVYSCADGMIEREIGSPTEAEEALFRGRAPSLEDADIEGMDPWNVVEEDVMALAGAWSVNPSLLPGDFQDAGNGFLGKPAKVEVQQSQEPRARKGLVGWLLERVGRR